MLKRALLLAALALVLPAPAFAGTFSKQGSDLVYTGTSRRRPAERLRLVGHARLLHVHAAGDRRRSPSGCVFAAANWNCPSTGYTRFVVRGHGGERRRPRGRRAPRPARRRRGRRHPRRVRPGRHARSAAAGTTGCAAPAADDHLSGGAGADRLEGGDRRGRFSGGDGVDVVNYYTTRPAPRLREHRRRRATTATAGERRQRPARRRGPLGGAGRRRPRRRRGSSRAAHDPRRPTATTRSPARRARHVSGEAGTDTILARDGVADDVDCGAGAAPRSRPDRRPPPTARRSTRATRPSPTTTPTASTAPPTATTATRRVSPGCSTPENGIDEDCSGADAPQLDRDHDGFPVRATATTRAPRSTRRARDRRQRHRRELRRPAQPYPAIGVVVGDAWDHHRGKARIARLRLDRVKRGTVVTVRCTGKGCKPAKLRVKAKRRGTLAARRPPRRDPAPQGHAARAARHPPGHARRGRSASRAVASAASRRGATCASRRAASPAAASRPSAAPSPGSARCRPRWRSRSACRRTTRSRASGPRSAAGRAPRPARRARAA